MTGRDIRKDDRAEVVAASNLLADKVRLRTGDDSDALFRAADGAIVEQARGYRDHALAECAAAGRAIDAATAADTKGDGPGKVAALDRLYGIAHDMKGQGVTFGYPLATEIAGLICLLLVRRPHLDAAVLKIVQAHVNGLGVVLEQKFTGDGGPLGRQLVDRLRRLAERARH